MGCDPNIKGNPSKNSIELMGGLAQLGIYAQLAEGSKSPGGEVSPPPDQQRTLRFWLWSRAQSYHCFLNREIDRVHSADEKIRPFLEVEFSDGPAWVKDHAWVSGREQALRSQQEKLKRKFPFIHSGPLSSGSPLDGKWSQLVQRLPEFYSLELAQLVQVLRKKLEWVFQIPGRAGNFEYLNKELDRLLAGPPGKKFSPQKILGHRKGIQDFSRLLDEIALKRSAQARLQLYDQMLRPVQVHDRLFNFMVGLTVFGDVYHSDDQSDFSRMKEGYLEVLSLAEENNWEGAYQRFVVLEGDPKIPQMMENYEFAQAVQRYGIDVGLILAAAFSSGASLGALGLSEGSLIALGQLSGRQLATRLLVQSSTFVASHRVLGEMVTGQPMIYDRQASLDANLFQLAEEIMLTAGMFHLLGGSQKLFQGTLGKNLSPRLNVAGSFTTEYSAFTAWELVEASYQGAKDPDLPLKKLWSERLSATSNWDRLLFLLALKAGGGLSQAMAQASQQKLQEYFKKKPILPNQPRSVPSGIPEGFGPQWVLLGPETPGRDPLMMSSEDGSGKKPGPKAPEEPKTLTDQKILNTVLIPGRKSRPDKRRIPELVHQKNLEVLRNFEADPELDLGAIAANFDQKTLAQMHLFEGGTTWVRFFFNPDGTLIQALDNPGRDPRGKGILPTPRARGLPVDVLMAPDGETILWYDPYVPGSHGLLGSAPLEAMEALMDATRMKRRAYFERRPFDVEVALSQTVDRASRERDPQGPENYGKMALDFLDGIYSKGLKGEPEMTLHLYRDGKGHPRIGPQAPQGTKIMGRVQIRALMEGDFAGLRGVRIKNFYRGNLDTNFIYRFESLVNYLNGQFGFIQERYELGDTQRIPLDPKSTQENKEKSALQSIRDWWKKTFGY